ncbi:MAG: MFS transporter [Lentisphaeria bacterium]|nr:MFS transporter [Lentisphaeria bacterium]
MKYDPSMVRLRFLLILICGTALYFFANVQRVGIPGAVFDRLQQAFGCTASGIAGLGAAFMFAYALMQPLTGLLLDRYGSGRVLIGGGLLFVAGMLWFARSGSLPAAYGAQILGGLGAGSLYLTLVRENIRLFRENYNLTLAIIILIGYSGGIAANAPLLMVIRHCGLRTTLTGAGILAGISGLLAVLLILRGRLPEEQKQHTFSPREFVPVFRLDHNWKLYIFSAVNFGLFYALQTVIGKKFMQDFCDLGELPAGWLFSATGATAAVSGLVMASASHYFGNRRQIFCRIAGVSNFTVFALIFALICCDVRSGLLFSILLLMLSGTASLSTIVIPLLRETNPEMLSGRAVCMLNFSFYLAVAFFGNLAGQLLKLFQPVGNAAGAAIYGRSAWMTLFGVFLLGSLAVLYFSFQMKETYGRRNPVAGLQ